MAGWRKGKLFQEKLLIPMHRLRKAFPGKAVTERCLCHTCWIRAFRVGLAVFFSLSGAHRSWVCLKSVLNAEYSAFKRSWASLSHPFPSEGRCSEWEGNTEISEHANVFQIYFGAGTNPLPTQHSSGCSQLVPSPQGEKTQEGAVGNCFWEAERGTVWKARRLSEGWMQFPLLDGFPRRIYLVAEESNMFSQSSALQCFPLPRSSIPRFAWDPMAEPTSPFPWAFPSSQCLEWPNLLLKQVGNHRSQLRGSTWGAEEEESCHRAI